MRVLLVKPYNISDHIQPSLGLGYLATAIRNKGQVGILDCIKDKITLRNFERVLKSWKPDIVGMQCYTFDLKFIKDAFRLTKDVSEKIITMVGGPHPSAVPVETMDYFGNSLDFASRGESEKSLSLFLDRLHGASISLSDIPGLIWRKDGNSVVNEPFFDDNLDGLGIPSWDLIRPQTYPESQHGAFYKKFPIAPIMLTRGCPYSCTFCAGKVISGKKIRKRSITHVINEIKMLYHEYGIREFHIVDDNFTFDLTYAKDFLRALIVEKLDISLATPNGIRMDKIDGELLALMKKCGFYLISLGIESGSDRILQLMKKNITVEEIKEKLKFIKSYGLDIAGFFILGFPGETEEDIRKTIRFSLELKLLRANFFTYLPFPGTESYLRLRETGELHTVDWDDFYFMSAAYVPQGLERKRLKRLQRYAFLRFYLRPNILWRNMLEIRSIRHLKYLLKRFFNWVI